MRYVPKLFRGGVLHDLPGTDSPLPTDVLATAPQQGTGTAEPHAHQWIRTTRTVAWCPDCDAVKEPPVTP